MRSTAKPTGRRLVKFAPKGEASFYDTVKERVRHYFEQTGKSPVANSRMYWKSVAMLAMYFVPLVAIIAGIGQVSLLLFYACWGLMGVGLVGIGTSIMHDSNHGSYSDNKAVNYIMGSIINLMGAYTVNWRIQHNILHHTYTNVSGLDDDIDSGKLLRMSPHQEYHGFHKWQHIYSWPLYALMNIYWVFAKDYKQAIQFEREGLLRKEKKTLRQAIFEITAMRLFFFGYTVALPILLGGVAWWHVIIGFMLVQVIAGFSLACIFQPAHVMETSDYAQPDEKNKIENSWAIHQVLNTANFAPRNRFLTWFIGGLNRQIEHHLFPQICHVHYPALARIVKKTAREYDLPYHEYRTFRSALKAHYQMLKALGQPQPELSQVTSQYFTNTPKRETTAAY